MFPVFFFYNLLMLYCLKHCELYYSTKVTDRLTFYGHFVVLSETSYFSLFTFKAVEAI